MLGGPWARSTGEHESSHHSVGTLAPERRVFSLFLPDCCSPQNNTVLGSSSKNFIMTPQLYLPATTDPHEPRACFCRPHMTQSVRVRAASEAGTGVTTTLRSPAGVLPLQESPGSHSLPSRDSAETQPGNCPHFLL